MLSICCFLFITAQVLNKHHLYWMVLILTNEFSETFIKRRIRRYHDTEKFLFRKLMITTNSSCEYKEGVQHLLEYADAIRIESVEIVVTDTGGYDEREEPLEQGHSISTYYRYIQTEFNKQTQKKLWNISVGMLEKSHNTSQRSSSFTSLGEANYN